MDVLLCSPEALDLEEDSVALGVLADRVLRLLEDLFGCARCIYVESAMFTEEEPFEEDLTRSWPRYIVVCYCFIEEQHVGVDHLFSHLSLDNVLVPGEAD